MSKQYREIGERFIDRETGAKLMVQESDEDTSCNGCFFFFGTSECGNRLCSHLERIDEKMIIFVQDK